MTFTGDSASDTLTLGQQGGLLTHNCSAKGDAGFASAVDFDSKQPGEQPLSVAQIGTITINGGAGNDTLVINNPAGSVFAPGATIFYNGQEGYDVLVVQGAGGPDLRATYLPGPTADAGVIETTSGALSQVINFTGLEPVTVSGLFELTVVTPNSRDVVTIDSPGAGQNRVSGTSGNVAFEAITFSTVNHVLVDTGRNDGPGPDDTVTFASDLVATGLQSFTVSTGPGNDTVNATNVTSLGVTLLGGDGDDTLTGGAGNDRIEGGDGFDTINGGGGSDTLLGGADGDTLTTGAGLDLVDGGTGDDVVNFDNGNGAYEVSRDFAISHAGITGPGGAVARLSDMETINLAISATTGTYLVHDLGGSGVVRVNVNASGSFGFAVISFLVGTLTVEGTGGDDDIAVSLAPELGAGVQKVYLGWGQVLFNDYNGVADALVIHGLAGNDTIKVDGTITIATNITLDGDAGNDTLEGGAGNDRLDGGDGDDVLAFTAGNDTMIGGAGFDVIQVNGNDAANTIALSQAGSIITMSTGLASGTVDITGTVSVERLDVFGLGGSDIITVSGVTLPNSIDAGVGNDVVDCSAAINCTIFGGEGSDILTGSPGADEISGGPGNDTITGGPGSDRLFGDADADTFIWNPGDGSDTIEGGTGVDALVFNGSAAAEVFTISATGARTTLTRDVGAVSMNIGDTEQMTVNGLAGDDVFNVAPQSTTQISINGGDPPAPATPGDRLFVVLTGTTSPSLTPTNTGSGIWSFANRQSVVFAGIEETAAGFTDQTVQFVPIQVVHVNELRSRINAVRARFLLVPFAWTDATLVGDLTPIRAVHIAELRAALQAAYVAAGTTPPSFTDDPLTPGATVVQAVHIEELRDAVIALE